MRRARSLSRRGGGRTSLCCVRMGNLVHKAPSPEIPTRKKTDAVCAFSCNLRRRSACDLNILPPQSPCEQQVEESNVFEPLGRQSVKNLNLSLANWSRHQLSQSRYAHHKEPHPPAILGPANGVLVTTFHHVSAAGYSFSASSPSPAPSNSSKTLRSSWSTPVVR